MYSRKMVPWDCVNKLRGNLMFKALLRIKNAFKSINFDLAKSVSPPTHHCTGWYHFDGSRNFEIFIYFCIPRYYVIVFGWLYKDTAHCNSFNSLQAKPLPPTSFSPVTSTNVGISLQKFLTFNFNPFSTLT